jgi:peptide/nickel transport system substrate-binding protein
MVMRKKALSNKVFLSVIVLLSAASVSLWGGGQGPAEEEGAAMAPTGKYNEAPMLTALVAAGELPAVEERLPEEPAVLVPLEEVGKYGDTIHVYTLDNRMWAICKKSRNGATICSG